MLDVDTLDRLRTMALTYPAGSTLEQPPVGFHRFCRTRQLARGDFDKAARDLLGWRVHERAGVQIAASAAQAQRDEVVLLRIGLGPLALMAPCRVLEVVERSDRRGFVYGTLQGHPVSGCERFVIERAADGTLSFTVQAFSRPASRLTRGAGPFGRLAQSLAAQRYLRALDQLRERR
ncbi:MAG: DUF1990 domain-containing protein [Nocardioidaceae bacterium]|nr:DUF1990 domain-containing protein [Nocardioidaceae bacterium]